jgi:hypothetical protein
VKASSLWEFQAAAVGWIAANCPEDKGSITAEEEDELWEGLIDRAG